MQCLEVSCAVRPIYGSLGTKGPIRKRNAGTITSLSCELVSLERNYSRLFQDLEVLCSGGSSEIYEFSKGIYCVEYKTTWQPCECVYIPST
jgi:hypothetical protein